MLPDFQPICLPLGPSPFNLFQPSSALEGLFVEIEKLWEERSSKLPDSQRRRFLSNFRTMLQSYLSDEKFQNLSQATLNEIKEDLMRSAQMLFDQAKHYTNQQNLLDQRFDLFEDKIEKSLVGANEFFKPLTIKKVIERNNRVEQMTTVRVAGAYLKGVSHLVEQGIKKVCHVHPLTKKACTKASQIGVAVITHVIKNTPIAIKDIFLKIGEKKHKALSDLSQYHQTLDISPRATETYFKDLEELTVNTVFAGATTTVCIVGGVALGTAVGAGLFGSLILTKTLFNGSIIYFSFISSNTIII